jgi:hypothetical protein
MEESDAEGDVVELSEFSTDMDLVENMVAIPVPAPSVVHALVPVEDSLEFIPPVLQSEGAPLPPYITEHEEDPMHDGVPELWVETK